MNITAKNVNNSFAKYRISEALVDIYKLFKDEFSAWYLEVIKPEYEQPIDKKTYQITLGFFDSLLKLLHPFIPFITEELWQSLEERKDGESIMISAMPITKSGLGNLVRMEEAKEIVSNIRTIRLQKKISNKEKLVLQIVGNYKTDYNSVIIKMSNLSTIEQVKEKTVGSIPFLVKTIECAVPMKYNIHKRDELNKLEKDLQYYRDFLSLILRKLNDENFVSKAPIQIIEAEYKKQADAESKIKSLEESIALLK